MTLITKATIGKHDGYPFLELTAQDGRTTRIFPEQRNIGTGVVSHTGGLKTEAFLPRVKQTLPGFTDNKVVLDLTRRFLEQKLTTDSKGGVELPEGKFELQETDRKEDDNIF